MEDNELELLGGADIVLERLYEKHKRSAAELAVLRMKMGDNYELRVIEMAMTMICDDISKKLSELSDMAKSDCEPSEFLRKADRIESNLDELEGGMTVAFRKLKEAKGSFDPAKNRNQLVYGPPEMFGKKD